jgi:NAD-dependent DNA ligase
VVLRRIDSVLADGMVTDEERSHLIETLQQLVGGSFTETGAVPDGATALPIDVDADVSLTGRSFCFTGQFLFGTRSACEQAVADRGGTISGVKKGLAFLVIGELSSRDWKHSSFGTKIVAAMKLRAAGASLMIVSEAQWIRAL